MKYRIHVQTESQFSNYGEDLIEVAQAALSYVGAPPGELSLVLSHSEHIRDLNLKFRDVDQPTDVLAFKGGIEDPDSGMLYFGDVIIAVPIAELQAESAGHSPAEELALLTIHGTLHLLDYDHSEEKSKTEMWEVQSAVLRSLGLSVNEPR